MENVFQSSALPRRENYLYIPKKEGENFELSFSELEILELQDLFLTFGVQYLKTSNVQDGRRIIETILKSLNYYQNIACITQESTVNQEYFNIYQEIILGKNTSQSFESALEEFLLLYPHFDFVWIELTKSLKNTKLCENVEQIFDMYHVEERLPVVIVMYDQS